MKLTITKTEQAFTKDGAEYVKVTGINIENQSETTKSVFDNLKEKWGLLKEGATLELAMTKKGQFWNVADIKPITTPPPTEPQPIPTSNREPIKQQFDSRQDSIEKQVAIKEIGEDWRADKRKDDDALVVAREDWLYTALDFEVGVTNENTPTESAEKTADKETKQTTPKGRIDELKDLQQALKWNDKTLESYIKSQYHVSSIDQLESLDELISNLKTKLKGG